MNNSVAAYSHDNDSMPLVYEISKELYEEALAQIDPSMVISPFGVKLEFKVKMSCQQV